MHEGMKFGDTEVFTAAKLDEHFLPAMEFVKGSL